MMFWGSKNIKNSVKFSVHLNLFTCFLLIWNTSNDLSKASKNLEIQYQSEVLLNKSNNRLLAKYGTQENLKYQRLRDKLSEDVNNMNLKYRMNNTSTYGQLNKKKLNDLDAYKKGYKSRYSKKNGLAKLDCYYERKLFNKFDEIYELSRSMQNEEKKFKKKIYNKFGYGLLLFVISPIFGLIFPILFSKYGPFTNWCTSDCTGNKTSDGHDHNESGEFYQTQFNNTQWNAFFYINRVFFFTLLIIVLIVVICTLVKVIKYERLKAGKKKMNIKEYCRFCKEIL